MNPDVVLQRLMSLPRERGVKFLPGNKRARMLCQWHKLADGSREKTPSFFVNIQANGQYAPGSGHCFGCGKNIKAENFHVIIDPSREGEIADITDDADEQIYRIYNDDTHKLFYGSDEAPYDLRAALDWAQGEDWRGVPSQLMMSIKAQLVFDPDFRIMMAYLPCWVNNEHVGGVRARLQKKDRVASYYNTKGTWTRDYGLFPYDYVKALIQRRNLKTLVAVEGPRDSLRSCAFGIPSLAILGTGNWSEIKAELIYNLGVKRVITAFDPDAAGLRATKAVYESLRHEMLVQNFDFQKWGALYTKRTGQRLKENLDPGNMPGWIAQKLKIAAYQEI